MSVPDPDLPAATLAWVSDTEPGIQRVRHADGFRYVDARRRAVRDAETLQRIRQLAIPPAYEDVWICARPDGHLQATGRDARGRKQYRYHPQWQADRGQNKFDQLQRFASVLPKLRERVQRRLAGDDEPTRERVLATLVRLLDTTWLRIGNDEYARTNGSYGLSTLRNKHAGVKGAAVRLSFVGKSGVRHEVELTDKRLARVIRRCRELPGQELFQYIDDEGQVRRLGSSDVNAWLREAAGGVRVTAKDFRTWHGSVQALDLLLAACAPEAGACSAPSIVAAVAQRLGNTPAVCRKAYIHPQVLAMGEVLADDAARGAVLQRAWARRPPARRGLTAAERRLIGLLRERRR